MKDEEASVPLVFHSSSAKFPFTTKRKFLPSLLISKLVSPLQENTLCPGEAQLG